MCKLCYDDSKNKMIGLLLFILVEGLVVVWGMGSWSYFDNPYQRIAVVYGFATVFLDLIQHLFELIIEYNKVVK